MNNMLKTALALFFSGCMAISVPAMARGGQDDTHPDDHGSRSSEVNDDHGGRSNSSNQSSNSSSPNRSANRNLVSSLSNEKIYGKFKNKSKKNGSNQELSIKIKVKKNGQLITPNNLDEGVVSAVFPDGSVCELDADDDRRAKRFYEYSLKLRVRKGEYQEKDGFCDNSDSIPTYAGGSITIEFDDGAATVQMGRFNF
jgi:hypothetical protein